MRQRLSRLTSRLLLGVVASGLAGAVVAQPAWSAPSGCTDAAPAAVAAFFDHAVPDRLTHDRVPGVVVSVVSGGATVFSRGYGLADVEHGVPFDPARSLVRIASITKLFTWTAVMQQVEAGRLDLDADVNRYLTAFRVPATYPEPVTLRTLMDHTSGFEHQFIGTGARSAAGVPALGEYLAAHMPARIRPPGEVSAYSNYGAALAGYIVAQVSGEPYDRYVQRHLFQPLGMAHSTASEPVPDALAGDLARSYHSDETPARPVPFIFDPMAPDGSISTTANDMANFMIAHLRQGRLGDARILAPATVAQMHERSFSADPRLDGYAHGFKERTINGHRVLMHDGGWEGFESALLLVPGCDLGVFLSTNSTGGTDAASAVIDSFFDEFAPATAGPVAGQASAVAAPQAGFYQPTRHNESTVEKLNGLLGPLRLTVDRDGVVHFQGQAWTPQADGLYRRADGADHLTFLTSTGGRRYVATDGPAYELMPRSATLPVNLLVLGAFAVAALSALALPIAALWRRIVKRSPTGSGTWRAARWLAAGSAVVGLGFLVLLGTTVFGDTDDFIYGAPLSFRLLLAVPLVVLPVAVAATACTITGWRGSGAGVVVRVHQVALLTGIAALAWFLWQWNLIGWQV